MVTIRKRRADASKRSGARAGWSGTFKVQKFDRERGIALGWASFSKDKSGNLIIDHDEDVIRPPELERAAYRHTELHGTANVMHAGPDVGTLVESIYLDVEKRKAMGLGSADDESVGWWVGYRIHDVAAREKVARGDYPEFSIEGWADRVAMGTGAYELQNLEVEKVAFVDKGAGIGVQVALYKVRGGSRTEDNVNKWLKRLSKIAKRLGVEKMALLNAALGEDGVEKMLFHEVVAKIATMEDIKSKLTAEEWDLIMQHLMPADPALAEDPAAGGEVPPAAPPAPAKRRKARPVEDDDEDPEIEKLRTDLANVKKSAAAADVKVAELEKASKLTKYLAEAEKHFPFVPGKTEDIAKQLQAADDLTDKSIGKSMREQMTRTNEAVKQSGIFRSFGSTRKGREDGAGDGAGADGSDASAQLDKFVKGRIEKGAGATSYAKAIAEVAKENPELYREYYNERRKRGGAVSD